MVIRAVRGWVNYHAVFDNHRRSGAIPRTDKAETILVVK